VITHIYDLGEGITGNSTGVIGVADSTTRAGLPPFAGTIMDNLEDDRSR